MVDRLFSPMESAEERSSGVCLRSLSTPLVSLSWQAGLALWHLREGAVEIAMIMLLLYLVIFIALEAK